MPAPAAPLFLLPPPYRSTTEIAPDPAALRAVGKAPGTALVWRLGGLLDERLMPVIRDRPGGLALILVLPPPERLSDAHRILHLVEEVRPAGIMPHVTELRSRELAQVLRQPPEDLAMEVTEYLRWRGLAVDRDTVHLLRRTIDLSAELRSVSALARALYLSRRALGRRLMSRGLPVPSHWLHFARLLRVVIRLQNSDESVLGVGYALGYPDGFSLSNQMLRLTGHRPSEARECLGWEWFMEAWLRTEAEAGNLAPDAAARALTRTPAPASMNQSRRPSPDRRGRQVG